MGLRVNLRVGGAVGGDVGMILGGSIGATEGGKLVRRLVARSLSWRRGRWRRRADSRRKCRTATRRRRWNDTWPLRRMLGRC